MAIVLLTPASARPYVGGSADNNILNLTFSYNGLGRLTGAESRFSGAGGGGASGALPGNLPGASQGLPGGGGAGGMFGGATGITRLAASEFGGQVAWLLPAALLALAALIWLSWRAPRADQARAAALAWGGWLLVTGLVFSYMSGIIHPYYTVALAPAIGALVGIGSVQLWRARGRWPGRAVLGAGVVTTAAWAWTLLDRSSAWLPWLRVAIVVAAAAAAAIILAERALRSAAGWVGVVAVAAPVPLALIAGLSGPLAYSADTAAGTQTGSIPSAGPATAGSLGGSALNRGGGAFPSGGALPPGGELPGSATGFPGGPGLPGGTTGRDSAGASGGPAGSGAPAPRWPRCWRPGRPATAGPRPRSHPPARPRSSCPATASR